MHVPLALCLGILGLSQRIRSVLGDEHSPKDGGGAPTELDLVILGIFSIADRLAAIFSRVEIEASSLDPPSFEGEMLR